LINNRQQAGRRRGRGGNGNGGGNGPRQGGGQGRADNGNRIDNRSRGNANQLYEKYKNLAADAQRQGDRVNTEYYLQFADHYFRVLSDQRGRFDDQPQPQQRRNQPDFDIDGADDDYGDEGEPIRAGEQQGQDPRDRQNDGRQNDNRQNENRQNDNRQNADRQNADRQSGDRSNGQYQNGQQEPRGDRQREPRRQDGERAERPRRWDRDDRPRAQEGAYAQDGEVEVGGQHRADPVVMGEDLSTRAEAVIRADAPLGEAAPKRRGRPRREPVVATDAGGDDASRGAVAAKEATVDADRLPPSLGASLGTPANDADDDAPKPRRRRLRSAGTGDAPAE
jgi:hypothetical protein